MADDKLDLRWWPVYSVKFEGWVIVFTFRKGAIRRVLRINCEQWKEMVSQARSEASWRVKQAKRNADFVEADRG